MRNEIQITASFPYTYENEVDQILYECRVLSDKYDWDMEQKFKYIYGRQVDRKSMEESLTSQPHLK